MWEAVVKGCTTSATSPSTLEEMKALEFNTRAINAILSNLPNELITKVIYYNSAKEVWDKLTEMNQNSELQEEISLDTEISCETSKNEEGVNLHSFEKKSKEIINEYLNDQETCV